MSLFGDLKMYGRFAFGLPDFLRETITPELARQRIRHHLAERKLNFVRLLKWGVFTYPQSPYLPLFKLAGCALGDVENMLKTDGLEDTLLALREAGIYVTFEECKGRQPIVRGGQEIPVTAHSFDNPRLRTHYFSQSGGSTGAGTRVHHELDHLAEQSAHFLLTHMAHGVAEAPMALWRGVLPDSSGINNVLRMAHCGIVPQKWFSPVPAGDSSVLRPKFRLATFLTVAIARFLKVSVPWPEAVPVDKAETIARWAVETIASQGACVVQTVASRAVRVCVAAQDKGWDLTGTTFVVAGEPMTPRKAQLIASTGARYFPRYGFAEAGRIGMGCTRPVSSNDLHLLTDMAAIIPYPRYVPNAGKSVPAFNVTSLLPSTPKILLNAESDDYGIIENRACGCPLEELGFKVHVRDIRSFSKLTGEGVTLVGSELLHILEEVLPSRFGGSPLDYQLLEEEDELGLPRVHLLIDPRVQIPDEESVVRTVLEAMGRESLGADAARAIWQQTGTLRVQRRTPILTERGKLIPLHVRNRDVDNGSGHATSTDEKGGVSQT